MTIILKNIYKKYPNNQHYTVADFNLTVEDGEFIVFVGASGCGKSTVIRMIAGLEDIDSGQLIFDDKVVNHVAPKDRDIAMVFQNYALYPHMNVFDNMAFSLKLRGVAKEEIQKRVENAADILGLTQLLNVLPSQMSGGQRQRVAIGRAIVRSPKIFLMDEPLSNLDAKLRVQMRNDIAKLHQRLRTTTIYVTHDQTEAMTLATRIVIMKEGCIQQIGTPTELYNKPANMFVAGFIGSPSMNFCEVKLNNGRITNNDGMNFELPEGQNKKLVSQGFEGKNMILGIRPEDIKTQPIAFEIFPDNVIKAKVNMSEFLGSEQIVYLTIANTEFVAKIPARDVVKYDAPLEIAPDFNKAKFFDKASQNLIC